jgi:hypothetical protein
LNCLVSEESGKESGRAVPEVQAAQKALREWIETYPEERDWMRDGFEQLSLMQEIAEEEEARRLRQTTQAA